MPSVPRSPYCAELGCKNPRSKLNGYCLDHGGKDSQPYNPKYNAARKEQSRFYKTRQWLALRQIQLSKSPLCAGCFAEGTISAATTVDHLFPWTHIGETAFFINKFQSLCSTHHATKTQLEQHGIYRRFGTPQVDYALADYARVVGIDDQPARTDGPKLKK